MQTTVKGLIIREQTIGESDRLVTLLSDEFGLVKAFVRRAKNFKNQNLSSTSLFVYGEFRLYKGRDAYVIDGATPIEVFFALRSDIERLALAQYFAQLAYIFGSEEQPSHEQLRLLLNALHLLCKGTKNTALIKAAVELRMCCLGGYMPDITACYRCGTYETDMMFFDVEEGCAYCKDCFRNNALEVPLSVIYAMRYICLTEDVSRIFSFHISEANLTLLSQVCEKYAISRADGRLGALEFYKSLI